MNRRAIISLLSFSSFILITVIILLLANGYRLNRQTNQVYGTGILVVTSEPSGASITFNNAPHGATNANIPNLDPGSYHLKLDKDGYSAWEKDITITKNKVVTINALMVPSNPSLAPITATTAERPVISPDGQRVAYAVTTGTSPGLWMLDLTSQPFNLNKKIVQILSDSDLIHYSTGTFQWAPNSRDLLIKVGENPTNAYTLSTDNPNSVVNVDAKLDEIQAGWAKEQADNTKELSAALSNEGKALLQSPNPVIWSPDNLKFLTWKDDGDQRTYQIYNKEAKRVLTVANRSTKTFSAARWYADSQHVLLLEKESLDSTSGKVSLMEMDGSNTFQVYSGTLIGDALYSYLNGSKLVILTSFNLPTTNYYLYSINLR